MDFYHNILKSVYGINGMNLVECEVTFDLIPVVIPFIMGKYDWKNDFMTQAIALVYSMGHSMSLFLP